VSSLNSPNCPPLAVRWSVDPARRSETVVVVVTSCTPTATVGDLADALGVGRRGLWIDGRSVSGVVPLHDCGLVVGSLVSPWGTAHDDPVEASWELRVVAGPDAGERLALRAGVTVIGGDGVRRPGPALVVADPGMAPFHAALEVPAGRGRSTAEIVCVPLADRLTQRCGVPPAVPVRLADTVVWVVARTAPVPHDLGGVVEGRRVLRRPPRVAPGGPGRWPSLPALGVESVRERSVSEVPAAQAAPTAALIGAGVTVALALALRQPMLALFGLSGAVVALATWGHSWFGTRRRRGRARAERTAIDQRLVRDEQARRDALAVRLRSSVVDLCECLARVERLDPRLWERRPDHTDTWSVVLGIGEDAPDPTGDVLHAVPVEATLAPGTVVGLAGDRDAVRGVVRSLVMQLVANVGPADLDVRIVTDDTEDWAWTGWLPHSRGIERHDPAVAVPVGGSSGAVLTVVDSIEPCRLENATGSDIVVVLGRSALQLPSGCTSLGTLSGSSLRWHASAAEGLPLPVHAAGLHRAAAESAAARLAGLRDPESVSTAIDGPVSLADLVPDTGDEIARAWDALGADPAPTAPLGRSSSGVVHLDLVHDGPHTLVGGTTGAGKSELLRTLVVGLAASSPPEYLSFLLVDYKGGAAFDACERLPHVVGTVTDLDGASAQRALRSLHAELRRREHVMRRFGVSDMTGLRRAAVGDAAPALARLVVVVDEFATLAAELPDFLTALIGVAQRGRSLGVHLVLATQRPGGVVTDDIRANTNLRIALRVASVAEAVDVVGDPIPASFSRDRPGRAAVRLGHDELTIVQVASTQIPPARAVDAIRSVGVAHPAGVVVEAVHDSFSATRPGGMVTEGSDERDRLVDAIVEAAARRDRPAPRPPWCPPLPVRLTVDDLVHPTDHGLLDDPDDQTRQRLVWDPERGHLLVVGAVGAGCTSTLLVVAARHHVADDPGEVDGEVVVIDAVGDARWTEAAAAVGAVVRVTETERLVRVVHALSREIAARRRSTIGSPSRLVVMIDGIGAVRSVLGDLDHELLDDFDRLLADGPGVGVVVAAAASDMASVPLGLVTRSVQRWVLRLADPLDGSLLGVPTAEVPGHRAPPGRVVALPERLIGQVLSPDQLVWRAQATPLCLGSLEPLSARVTPDDVGDPFVDGSAVLVPLGIGWSDLSPVRVRCEPGEHLVIVGPSRSGRSTLLGHIVRMWTRASNDRVAVVLNGRGAAHADLAGPTPAALIVAASAAEAAAAIDEALGGGRSPLLAVDDAERVDDPTGRLAAALATGAVGSVVTGRAESLRSAYGHWTSVVRRSRSGVVLGRLGGNDADVLGVLLPRRVGVPDAPGRGWLIVDGAPVDVVQTPAPPTG
jgi:S-DNA-T family DNA segregation ATPase FtsK/SpoIIIE